jgi:hypothetical protein
MLLYRYLSRAVSLFDSVQAAPQWADCARGPNWGALTSPKQFKRIRDAEYRIDLKDQHGILQTRLWLSAADKARQQDLIALSLTREPRTVTGRVTRGDDPVQGVYLFGVIESKSSPPEDFIPPPNLLLEYGARTNPNGYYSLEIGDPGVYKIGYADPPASINGNSELVDLTVTTSAEVNISLAPRVLTIEVASGKTHEPINGASLSIMLWKSPTQPGTSFTVETDERGRYTNGSLSQEKASVTASAPHFETRSLDLPIGLATPDAEPARIELQPASALRLRVSDSRGIPISQAEVWTLESPGPSDVEPRLNRIAAVDPTGLAVIESPSSDPRPYFILSRGFQLDLVVASGSQDPQDIAVSLSPVEATPPFRLRRSGGQPAVQSALAFRRFGVIYPWSLLGVKTKQEGLDFQTTLASDSNGRIPVHELLAPGDYDVFLFAPADFQSRPRHLFAPLGRVTLPLQTETTLTVGTEQKKGGNP